MMSIFLDQLGWEVAEIRVAEVSLSPFYHHPQEALRFPHLSWRRDGELIQHHHLKTPLYRLAACREPQRSPRPTVSRQKYKAHCAPALTPKHRTTKKTNQAYIGHLKPEKSLFLHLNLQNAHPRSERSFYILPLNETHLC